MKLRHRLAVAASVIPVACAPAPKPAEGPTPNETAPAVGTSTEAEPTTTVTVATTSTTVAQVAVAEFAAPVAADLSQPVTDIEWAILRAFGPAGPAAVRVARCESGLVPAAANGAHAGLFQLSAIWHQSRAARLGYVWADMFAPLPNIDVAYDLWAEQGWSPWTCQP